MKTVMFAPTTVLARVQTAFITITRDLVQPDLTLTYAVFTTANSHHSVTVNNKIRSICLYLNKHCFSEDFSLVIDDVITTLTSPLTRIRAACRRRKLTHGRSCRHRRCPTDRRARFQRGPLFPLRCRGPSIGLQHVPRRHVTSVKHQMTTSGVCF